MFNFEIKTKILDYNDTLKKVREIGAKFDTTIVHRDYYFQMGVCKEKLREINNQFIEFISYKREEKEGRKDSRYNIDILSLKQRDEMLEQKKVLCVVDKERQIWIYKNTRIHLDKVKNLGNFLELETVIKTISSEDGLGEFEEVVKKLKINKNNSEPFSYSDLILNKNVTRTCVG